MLPASLKRDPKPVYLVSSDEPLLLRDWLDQARQTLYAQGFEEIVSYQVESGFDWNALLEQSHNLSLFSSRQCHFIRFSGNKPGQGGSRFIDQVTSGDVGDDLYILIMSALDRASHNSSWLKKIQSHGELCELKPVYANQLAGWISQRALQKNINLDHQAALYIADLTEGNLLATDQELEKLMLAFSPGATINLEQVKDSIARSARYSHFLLTDACLGGLQSRALKILRGLELEGFQPIQIQYALQNAFQTLLHLKVAQRNNRLNDAAWRSANVWKSKQRMYQQALSRFSERQIERFLHSCAKLDRINKGQQPDTYDGADWQALKFLICQFVGIGQFEQLA